ncbi:MAG TPA: hypothetical protein [Caudoviricetes sp.]|nr:MAG TPA: hypothetical protein [Caudoviricetes sp.]
MLILSSKCFSTNLALSGLVIFHKFIPVIK